ncbi:WD40 repeat-like protein [Mytilinidion resinicola]|uniref:Mitochondrial division protein 1 n=1 Tax=Mytilinidion resinicola TaxID=574789 RepID=A0A6A6YNR7_9PEZI|nr:WD40 repeat-like protein [Mytilinidion resinicola]KAF2809507.1 WD40 repeat-like protein [Mytilinidion resinicola]
MSKSLRKDICNLRLPGTLAEEVDRSKVEECIPAQLQYACSYWIRHLQKSLVDPSLLETVCTFLKQHFLHWFEVLSLLRKMDENTSMLVTLHDLVQIPNHQRLFDLVRDVYRFGMTHRSTIIQAPLQTYCAALIFSPSKSKVRALFEGQIPSWVKLKPSVPENWTSLLQTLEGHLDTVQSVASSGDGQKIVSGSNDKTARIWDARSGSLLQTLEGHLDWMIVSGSGDKTVRIWDARSGSLLHTLEGNSTILSVAFSDDGRKILSGSDDCIARVWDIGLISLPQSSLPQTLEGHLDSVLSVAFSGDAQKVASAEDYTVRIWDAQSGSLLHALEGYSVLVTSVAFSRGSQTIVSGSLDFAVRIWDARPGSPLHPRDVNNEVVRSEVWSVALSAIGQKVVSGHQDKTVRVWDVGSSSLLQTSRGHLDQVTSVAFSGDGQKVVSGSNDNTARVWAAGLDMDLQTPTGHSEKVWAIAFSPNGQKIVSGSEDTTVRIWDAGSGSLPHTLKDFTGYIRLVAFSSDGWKIALRTQGSAYGQVWDLKSGTLLEEDDLNPVSTAAPSSGVPLWKPDVKD